MYLLRFVDHVHFSQCEVNYVILEALHVSYASQWHSLSWHIR